MSILLFVMSLVLVGCTNSSDDPVSSGLTCTNSSDCLSEELCVEKTCQAVECATSLDCELEEYCSTSKYECKDGCKDDDDCFAGDSCNKEAKECESYGCRTSELDCGIGEFCNELTAECYRDSRGHCESFCTWNEVAFGENTNGECANYDMGSGSCMGDFEGNQSGCSGGDLCWPNDFDDMSGYYQQIPGTCISFYRFFTCDDNSAQEQCPNGFTCQGIPYSDGTVTQAVCLGDCPYYLESGYLQ